VIPKGVRVANVAAQSVGPTLHASWRIATVLAAAVALGRIAGAENIAGPSPVVRLDPGPGQGAFRHLRALQGIAVANGGNRAAGMHVVNFRCERWRAPDGSMVTAPLPAGTPSGAAAG
jgi:hypothetical protein